MVKFNGSHEAGDLKNGDFTMSEVLNVKAFAKEIAVSESTARRMVLSGAVQSYNPNKKTTRIPVSEVARIKQGK